MTQLTTAEQFEASKKHVASLNERRTRLQGQRDTVVQQMAEARKEAEALFGTSDLGKLRELFAAQEKANAAALAELAAGVQEAETVTARIEFLLANPDRLLELEAELEAEPPVVEPAAAPVATASTDSEDI